MPAARLALPFDTDHIALPEDGQIVILRAMPNAAYDMFPLDRLTCVQTHKPTYDTLVNAGFPASTTLPDRASLVLVHLTRSRDENRAMVATAHGMLDAGDLLVIDGVKTDGIDSLLKTLKKITPIDGHLSKSHGKIAWLTKGETPPEFADWLQAMKPKPNTDGFLTQAGMFSADGIDPGSRALAEQTIGQLKGNGADLGAGWGWLSLQALSQNPGITRLDLVEAEHIALDCARENVTDPRATFQWADATAPEANKTHDFIIMNPPFHQSRAADPDLGRRFIQAAAKMLKPNGKLFLVANRQLAYEKTLAASFHHVEQTSLTNSFKTVLARKPKQ